MEYMGTAEAAQKWGYSVVTIRKWCKDEEIQLIVKPKKVSGRWRIPKDAECPKVKRK